MNTDLSLFSGHEFHATNWINQLVEEIPPGENLETIISSMSMRLHMAAQDYSEQLETAMVESMSTMPRMVTEITRLQDQLKSMQDEMIVISEHIHSVDQRSVAGVEELSRLDHIKSNMEKCRSTLEEHARWSQLVREARSLLEGSGELAETADRIQIMHNSLEILKKLPGHQERKETYETFRSTLLNALTPNLRKEINEMSVTTLQEYLYVYRKLDSYEDFVREYVRNRPINIITIWKSSSSSDHVLSHQSFSEWIALFLGTVAKFITDEEPNIFELFGTAEASQTIETNMLKEIFTDMHQELNNKLQKQNNLQIAYECYCIIDEFMKRISTVLNKSTIKQRIELFDIIFGSFQLYLPSYLELEDKMLKERLYSCIQSITFSTKNGGGGAGLSSDGAFGNTYDDELEQLTNFIDLISSAIDEYLSFLQDRLQYCLKIFGGIFIRSFSKNFVQSILLFIKLITYKFTNFAIALGIEKDIPSASPLLEKNSTNGNQPTAAAVAAAAVSNNDLYPNYHEEIKFVQKIATKIAATTEYDTQMLSINVLKSLQLLGRFLKLITQLEFSYRSICIEVQKSLTASESFFPNEIETIAKRSMSYGQAYGIYLMLHDSQNISELKSFLSNNTGIAITGVSSSASASLSSSSSLPSSSSSSTSSSLLLYSQGLFSSVNISLKKLKSRIGNTLIGLSNQIPLKLIQTYSHEEVFTRQVSNQEELEIAKLNLLPQTAITQVGEHLLAWVQDLESFASSEAYNDIQILRGEAANLLPSSIGWNLLKSQLEIADEKLITQLSDRVSCTKLISAFERELIQTSRLHGVKLVEFIQRLANQQDNTTFEKENDLNFISAHTTVISTSSGETAEGENPTNTSTIVFVNEWLSVIADSIIAIYLSTILKLSAISNLGSFQLLTDIDYLSNVVNAVGIRPHPLLLFARSLIVEDQRLIAQCLQTLSGSGKSLGALKDLLKFSSLLNANLSAKK